MFSLQYYKTSPSLTSNGIIHTQLHTWAKFLGILMSVGGAIELTLTDDDEVPATLINGSLSDDNSSHSSGVHYAGYIAVCFNTMLTVSRNRLLSISLFSLHTFLSFLTYMYLYSYTISGCIHTDSEEIHLWQT